MNDLPVMAAPEVVKKVRLLTFDRLALTDLSRLQPAVDELSSQSAVFENHYLQHSGFDAILKTQVVSELLVAKQILPEIYLLAADESPDYASVDVDDLAKQLPSGWTVQPVPDSSATALRDAWRSAVSQRDFVWVHTAIADSDQLERALQTIQAVCDDQSLLIVTSLHGADASEAEAMPFESLLPEAQIRIPLWLQGAGLSGYRIQGITGSLDVMQTVRDVLSQQQAFESGEATPAAGSLNLLALARRPGQQTGRHVIVHWEAGQAVRSDNFLYVESRPESGEGEAAVASLAIARQALYAKPADVWNVHDVSGEYLDVTEQHSHYLS